jgi:hypothetical protein
VGPEECEGVQKAVLHSVPKETGPLREAGRKQNCPTVSKELSPWIYETKVDEAAIRKDAEYPQAIRNPNQEYTWARPNRSCPIDPPFFHGILLPVGVAAQRSVWGADESPLILLVHVPKDEAHKHTCQEAYTKAPEEIREVWAKETVEVVSTQDRPEHLAGDQESNGEEYQIRPEEE